MQRYNESTMKVQWKTNTWNFEYSIYPKQRLYSCRNIWNRLWFS